MATFDKTLFPWCPGAKTPARTDLSKTPDQEGHIPHRMPDGGFMPPGPSSETSSQDDSNNNYVNEGPDYPGDLDDKSPESSPPSMRPPSCSASPPPQYPKKAGLPHVNKTASHITINQKAYLKMVLERFDMHNAKITPTPIPLGYVPQENKGAVDPVW